VDWASAAFELARVATPNRITDVTFTESVRIVTFGPPIQSGHIAITQLVTRLVPDHFGARFGRIVPAADRQVRGQMRNRQETVKPRGKRHRALPWS
jgi:hypothetical protein